jgi:hypothetical protein
MNEVYEVLERKRDEELPPLNLKLLPKDLKYMFLDDTNKYHVIVSVDPTEKEE